MGSELSKLEIFLCLYSTTLTIILLYVIYLYVKQAKTYKSLTDTMSSLNNEYPDMSSMGREYESYMPEAKYPTYNTRLTVSWVENGTSKKNKKKQNMSRF